MAYGPRRRANTTALLEMDGVSSRSGFWRYDVLDQDGTLLGDVDVNRDRAPKISNDTTRKIKRTLSGLEIDPVAAADLDTIGTLIRPVFTLEDGATFPMGAFLFVDASRPRTRAGLELDGSLHDQLFILDQPTDKTVSFGRGRNLSACLETIANRYGIHRASIESTSKNVGTPIAWAAGSTTGLSIMEELCTMAGFYSPYFDNLGRLVIQAAPAPNNAIPEFSYNIDQNGRIVADTPVESDDLLDAPNVFIVIDDSATAAPIVGRYELPASSPISIANRGYAVSKTESSQGLHNQQAADNAARTLAAESPAGFKAYSFDAVPDYRHDTFDVLTYRGIVCREIAWDLECDPTGLMTHQVREFYQ